MAQPTRFKHDSEGVMTSMSPPSLFDCQRRIGPKASAALALATRRKGAAVRAVQANWRQSIRRYKVSAPAGIGGRHRLEKGLRIGVLRTGKHLCDRTSFDNPA